MSYEKHIFICINERPSENPVRCCGSQGMSVRMSFVRELAKYGLKNKVRANKSGCLDSCSLGPMVVVYPDGIWYKGVTPEDVPEIVQTSIINNNIVDRLHMSVSDWENRK